MAAARSVDLEYRFHRLADQRRVLAYRLLVPEPPAHPLKRAAREYGGAPFEAAVIDDQTSYTAAGEGNPDVHLPASDPDALQSQAATILSSAMQPRLAYIAFLDDLERTSSRPASSPTRHAD